MRVLESQTLDEPASGMKKIVQKPQHTTAEQPKEPRTAVPIVFPPVGRSN
jgi:hypothetical protein